MCARDVASVQDASMTLPCLLLLETSVVAEFKSRTIDSRNGAHVMLNVDGVGKRERLTRIVFSAARHPAGIDMLSIRWCPGTGHVSAVLAFVS